MNAQALKLVGQMDPVKLAIGAVIVLGGVYFIARKGISDTVGAVTGSVGGVLSGNNAITKGTVYENKGILGTLGSATNEVSGGLLEDFGSWLGGKAFELFNKPYDPNMPKTPALYQIAAGTSPLRPQDKASSYVK